PAGGERARRTLATAGGPWARALAGPALDAAAVGPGAARVRQELLGKQLKVPAGMTAFRFLVYPPGSYREARLSVEDVETGESDGFVTAGERRARPAVRRSPEGGVARAGRAAEGI